VLRPCTTGDVLKKKRIVRLPFNKMAVFAGVPFTMKSLPWTLAGSAGPLRLTSNSVGGVPTTILPQPELVTEQPVGVVVGVGVGVDGL